MWVQIYKYKFQNSFWSTMAILARIRLFLLSYRYSNNSIILQDKLVLRLSFAGSINSLRLDWKIANGRKQL